MFDFWSLAIPSIIATMFSVAINQLVEHLKNKRQNNIKLTAIKMLLSKSIQNDMRIINTCLNQNDTITLQELQDTLNNADWQKLKPDLYSLNKKLSKIVSKYYAEQENVLRRLRSATFGTDYALIFEPCIAAGKKALSAMNVSKFVP